MINLTIDGRQISVPKGTTVYQAAKELGIYVPVFCYQDRMPPFGACRVCLVEVEKMGKPQTSCTLQATEGMVVKTQSTLALEGRNSILEFLLINHPLDCPICDRGGECPLQEHAYDYGPGTSRFYEEKRHYTKALPLGPVLMLDRERCIICARCTRFGDEVAGDHALEFIDRGYKTEVGTPSGKPVESKFIGNTIMICPVGALTSQVYRFRARPWDNDTAPSTCTLCANGCSMMFDSRDGEIVRTRAQENKEVNDIWLCDKGWFGYEFVNHPDRLKHPLIRKSGTLTPASWEEAFTLIKDKLTEHTPSGKIAAFGGNPLTNEENHAFQKLYRSLGIEHLDHRIGMPLHDISPGQVTSPTDLPPYILLLGFDITEEFPVLWLHLKQALNKGAQIHFIGHYAPEISPHLTSTTLHTPGQELKHLPDLNRPGAIFIGSQYLSLPNIKEILSHLSKSPMQLNVMEGRGNSMGAREAGMLPHHGLNALEVLHQPSWGVLHVAGANPATKFPSSLWSSFRRNLDFLIVQDLFLTETASQADIVLPTQSYVEKSGTFTNIQKHHLPLNPGQPSSHLSDLQIFEALKLNIPPTNVKITSKPIEMPSGSGLYVTIAPQLFDDGVRLSHCNHLKKLKKEPRVRIHPSEASKLGIQSGDKIRLGDIETRVLLDPQVAPETVVIPSTIPIYMNRTEIKSSRFNIL